LANWLSDIQLASSKGIDGFALNLGSDVWEADRVADAYAAAVASGTGFKMFFSFDMTAMSCSSAADAGALSTRMRRTRHSSTFGVGL
jgi:glucan endo-1,3-alpha-glucosidase